MADTPGGCRITDTASVPIVTVGSVVTVRERGRPLRAPGGLTAERLDVGAEILAVGPGLPVGARRAQTVVAAIEIHEADGVEGGGKKFPRWLEY